MVKMFNHFGFNININNVEQLFENIFDSTGEKGLNFDKFYSCIDNPEIEKRYNKLLQLKLA